MKRYINSMLIMLITLITVFAIVGYNVNNSVNTSNPKVGEVQMVQPSSDGPGYIFDDYNENVNIKPK